MPGNDTSRSTKTITKIKKKEPGTSSINQGSTSVSLSIDSIGDGKDEPKIIIIENGKRASVRSIWNKNKLKLLKVWNKYNFNVALTLALP